MRHGDKLFGSILIVDPMASRVHALRRELAEFRVVTAPDLEAAESRICDAHPSAVLVWERATGGVLTEWIAEATSESSSPIVVYASDWAIESRRVPFLEAGAAYYEGLRERTSLAAIVRAALRRAEWTSRARNAPDAPPAEFGNLRIDYDKRRVFVAERPVSLRPTEWRLLHMLASARGEVVERGELLSVVGSIANARVRIRDMRARLGADRIVTVPGQGYYLAS